MDNKLGKFEKLRIAARYWLLGIAEENSAYYKVLEAMELCLEHHNGLRNGGDPEAIHQLGIFHRLRRNHRHLRNPVTAYILAFLHDIVEDPQKGVDAKGRQTLKYITIDDIAGRFGSDIALKVRKLSKEILGQKNPDYSLDEIFKDPDTSVAKSADRGDNVSSMYGVFTEARRLRYEKETVEEFIEHPNRMKAARRWFPDQEGVYENIKTEMLTIMESYAKGTVGDTEPAIA